jgi:hypothetical protein
VHDLRGPHHHDPAAHTEQQDVLLPPRARITDPGAAVIELGEASSRGRTSPARAARARIEAPQAPSEVFVSGPCQKPARQYGSVSVPDTRQLRWQLPDTVLQINVHDEIFDADNYWFAPQAGAALLAFDCFEHVDVRVHPYFSDEELWDYLAAVSVSVLPYRFGTHSGWLEACFDLGTAVIAPSCGFYGQQHPCGVFTYTVDAFNADSLEAACARACPLAARPRRRAPISAGTSGSSWHRLTATFTNGCCRDAADADRADRLNRFPIRQPSQAGSRPTSGISPALCPPDTRCRCSPHRL